MKEEYTVLFFYCWIICIGHFIWDDKRNFKFLIHEEQSKNIFWHFFVKKTQYVMSYRKSPEGDIEFFTIIAQQHCHRWELHLVPLSSVPKKPQE